MTQGVNDALLLVRKRNDRLTTIDLIGTSLRPADPPYKAFWHRGP